MIEVGAVQLLREEVSLVVSSCFFMNSPVPVVVRLVAADDLVQQADGDAMITRQVPHGGKGISFEWR